MKPAAFRYLRALSVESALVALVSEADAKIIAGGQSLIPMMNLRVVQPACLIDINRLSELDYIRDAGDVIAIGALARHNSIRSSPLVARHCPERSAATSAMPIPPPRARRCSLQPMRRWWFEAPAASARYRRRSSFAELSKPPSRRTSS
jgi:CO/xanthine dehydrogenase FAD-binding subunit